MPIESPIDKMLRRRIYEVSPFEGLIPPANGGTHNFENVNEYSDTFDTLEFMAYWSELHYMQLQKVAPLLLGNTLAETVRNIYLFEYQNFQYKLDGQLQQLYTPARAWSNRKIGIDCKSYSVIASAILLNLGIPHAFRMVKQTGVVNPDFPNEWLLDPDAWTHVYVIVPDKNNTYHVIDATTHDNSEVSVIKKHDLFMKNLKHVGLSSPNPYGRPHGVGCGCNGLGLNLSDVQGMVSNLSCIGGSAYTDGILKKNLNLLNSKFSGIVQKINTAVQQKDMAALGAAVSDYKITGNLLQTVFKKRKASKSWNSCSSKNFDATLKAIAFFKDKCGMALDAWLAEYFSKGTIASTLSLTNQGWEVGHENGTGFWGMGLTPYTTVTEPKYNWTVQSDTAQVPAFAINEYLLAIEKSGTAFNLGTFLSGLSTIAGSFQNPSNSNGSGTSGGSGSGTSGGSSEQTNNSGGSGGKDDEPQPKGMSTGTKVALVGGTAALAFMLFRPKDTPAQLAQQYGQPAKPRQRTTKSKKK